MGQRVIHVQLGATDALRAGGIRPTPADRRPEPDINEPSRRQKKRRTADSKRKAKNLRAAKPKAKKISKIDDLMAEAKQLREQSRPRAPIATCICGWEGPTSRYQIHTTWLGNLDREHRRL